MTEESATAHLREALKILIPYRETIESPTPTYHYPVPSTTLRAIEARLYRALEQMERRNFV